MNKIAKNFKLVVAMVILFLPIILMAQGPEFPDGDNVDDVPFDGGISLLIAAGIGYGIKKVHDRKKA